MAVWLVPFPLSDGIIGINGITECFILLTDKEGIVSDMVGWEKVIWITVIESWLLKLFKISM